MAYRLKHTETVAEGIRRVAREQVERAIVDLRDLQPDPDEAVHRARKRFKKLRGVLRLVRPQIGPAYKRENVCLRDLGRKLALVRDAQAMVETMDKLVDRYHDTLPRRAFAAVRRQLVKRRNEASTGHATPRVRKAVGELEGLKRRLARWKLDGGGFKDIEEGLTGSYRRARKSMHVAFEYPQDENFHEWRKLVKHHWYHARLLRCLWPKLLNGYRRSLSELSELVGDDHDLSLFAAMLREHPEEYGAEDEVNALLDLITRRRAELQHKTRQLGELIFAEPPKAFAHRMASYWQTWHGKSD